jgi:hypothetical protein
MSQPRFHKQSRSEKLTELAEKLVKRYKIDEILIQALDENAQRYRASLVANTRYSESQIDEMVDKKVDEALKRVLSKIPDAVVSIIKEEQEENEIEKKEVKSTHRQKR